MIPVDDIIESIGELSPISPVVTEISTIASHADIDLAYVARLIAQDPALASNLLRRVNSAYFGLKKKIDTLQGAMTVMGTRQTIKMILANSISGHYRGQPFEGYDLKVDELWRCALISSEIAQGIALRQNHPHANRIFTAALIRDIGKIVMNQYVFDKMEEISRLIANKKMSYIKAEKIVMGISHDKLGAIVARRWNFPEPIAQIIERHHDETLLVDDNPEAAIVQAADAICSMIGIGTGRDGMQYTVSPSVAEKLMPEDQVERIIAETLTAKKELITFMSNDEP